MTIDYAKARAAMVEQQVRPWDVLDARVLAAMRKVPRCTELRKCLVCHVKQIHGLGDVD